MKEYLSTEHFHCLALAVPDAAVLESSDSASMALDEDLLVCGAAMTIEN